MVPPEIGAPPGPEQYPFRDRLLAAELAQRGFAVVSFLGAEEFECVRRVRVTHGPPPDDPRTGFFSDAWTHDRSYREAVGAALLDALGQPLDRLTDRHEVLAVAHLVKWPTPASSVTPHRDPSFVDERSHRSVTVWCPLTQATSRDGRLLVVAGSHRRSARTRPHDDEANLIPNLGEGCDAAATVVEVQPGSAVVFDHAIIHGSAVNAGSSERTSVAVLLTPADAEPEYSFLADDGVVHVVSVDSRFFLDHAFQDLDVPGILASHRSVRTEPAASSLDTRPNGATNADPVAAPYPLVDGCDDPGCGPGS